LAKPDVEYKDTIERRVTIKNADGTSATSTYLLGTKEEFRVELEIFIESGVSATTLNAVKNKLASVAKFWYLEPVVSSKDSSGVGKDYYHFRAWFNESWFEQSFHDSISALISRLKIDNLPTLFIRNNGVLSKYEVL
jgi:hypothetical protein